jgi:hypothetical protein
MQPAMTKRATRTKPTPSAGDVGGRRFLDPQMPGLLRERLDLIQPKKETAFTPIQIREHHLRASCRILGCVPDIS